MLRSLLLFLAMMSGPLLADDYTKSIETWRAERTARLTAPEGWLSLIGLHWLQPGDNTVGSAGDNSVRFTAGPAHIGTATLAADGSVTFTPIAEAGVTVAGKSA